MGCLIPRTRVWRGNDVWRLCPVQIIARRGFPRILHDRITQTFRSTSARASKLTELVVAFCGCSARQRERERCHIDDGASDYRNNVATTLYLRRD